MIKICLVRLSALGDCLHVLPLIFSLQKELNCRISWVISKSLEPLFRCLKNVEFIAIDKPGSFKDYRVFYQSMKGRKFDAILCLQSNLRANFLYPCIKAERKIGYKSLRAREGHRFFINECIERDEMHLLEHYFSFLDSIGVKNRVKPELIIPTTYFEKSFELVESSSFILINPFASKKVRNWPLNKMKSLVRHLCQKGLMVVITGSRDQIKLCSVLAENIPGALNLAGQTDYPLLAALVKRAMLVVAPDTGPLHMADILGTKLLGLYASSNPLASGPYYQRENVINKYPQALKKYFPKKKSPPPNFKVDKEGAMDLISYQQVLDASLKLIDQSRLQDCQ